MRIKKLFLAWIGISLLMTSLGISNINTFTDDQLRSIALKLRNYQVMSNELQIYKTWTVAQSNKIDFMNYQILTYKTMIKDQKKPIIDFWTAGGFTIGAVIGTALVLTVSESIKR